MFDVIGKIHSHQMSRCGYIVEPCRHMHNAHTHSPYPYYILRYLPACESRVWSLWSMLLHLSHIRCKRTRGNVNIKLHMRNESKFSSLSFSIYFRRWFSTSLSISSVLAALAVYGYDSTICYCFRLIFFLFFYLLDHSIYVSTIHTYYNIYYTLTNRILFVLFHSLHTRQNSFKRINRVYTSFLQFTSVCRYRNSNFV